MKEIGLDPCRLYPFVADRPPALHVSTLNLPDRETGRVLRRPKRGKERLRGRSIHDADHTCQNCVEDEMHFHMVGHVEGAHCEYGEEHGDLDLNEEHEVSDIVPRARWTFFI